MKKYKKIFIGSLIVGLSSLMYIDFYISNFKFSFAGVVFPFLILIYDEFNPILFGFTSGISLLSCRGLFYGLFRGLLGTTFCYTMPETIFYIVYGIIFYIIKRNVQTITYSKLFIISVFNDLFSNMVEVYIRIGNSLFTTNYEIMKVLFLVALVRAGLVWLLIMGYKYHKLFLVKEEHDKRYKNLLWLTSRLKTEIYWMEKNMDHIEKIMSDAYELFLNIKDDDNRENWANEALEIAKDVHEIKKEYGMVVAGIEEIMENRLDNTGMYFSELILILEETITREIKGQGKNISVQYDAGKNFYTEKHYYLMSILRNIISNAVDAIEDQGTIKFVHHIEGSIHLFIISDSGCGIKDEDLPHIFSPGYSTKIDYSTGQVNRGLGLTLIQNILRVQLKGDIKVESKEGRGTTFEISIPTRELEGLDE